MSGYRNILVLVVSKYNSISDCVISDEKERLINAVKKEVRSCVINSQNYKKHIVTVQVGDGPPPPRFAKMNQADGGATCRWK